MQGREHFGSTNIFSTRDERLQFSPPFVNLEFYNFALQKTTRKLKWASPVPHFPSRVLSWCLLVLPQLAGSLETCYVWRGWLVLNRSLSFENYKTAESKMLQISAKMHLRQMKIDYVHLLVHPQQNIHMGPPNFSVKKNIFSAKGTPFAKSRCCTTYNGLFSV